MSEFKSIGVGGQKVTTLTSSMIGSEGFTPNNTITDETNDKNERLAAVLATYSTESVFVDNRVKGVKATTSCIAEASLILAKTCQQSKPHETEKMPEAVGNSVYTITGPEKVYGDLDTAFMQIEKKELCPLLPLKHGIENRRIIFLGMGNPAMGPEIAEMIRKCYRPRYWSNVYHDIEKVEWCEYFLMIEVSEDEIENSFPGLTQTRNWLRLKNKLQYLSRREVKTCP